ncbi:probable pseudouridine-5'-phosphatase isoform X1 [Leguminivora glycinivorella]|uniref:probable pseudouridine-5'-phosphatase isoform X1 n=1 Tax=Leguminivora glycinivorella TaxID=1035111 RepID=UPI00200CA9AA|nr:probable pseudouridine-5'-phosphatase isoform X1 [Leguminivora glycinivorella]XP_048004075.1 probable pseudouridine-5'-phosphatase isoform X1 [Leguminivora glycinivorella]
MIPIPAKFYCTRKFKKVTHCLFDLDGTVLDSEVVYQRAIRSICEKYGKTYSKEVEVDCYGATDRDLSETIVQRVLLPISVDDFEHQLTDLVGKDVANAPLQPGAERLLTHLYDSKVPIALATNSTERSVRIAAQARPKLFALFNHKVCATDPEVDRGKPNPDIYLVAASRFPTKPKPAQCIVFEDSEIGVKAAVAAGMQVVMVPDRRLDRQKTREATVVLRSLRDFKPEEFGLPPFPETPAKGKPASARIERDETRRDDKSENIETKKDKPIKPTGQLVENMARTSKMSKLRAQMSALMDKKVLAATSSVATR